MDSLGGYLPQTPAYPLLRSGVFLGVLLFTAGLERLQARLREDESATWWASNGRDVLNVFALAACALGMRLLGFRGPTVLCLAAALTLLFSLVQQTIVERRLPAIVSMAAAAALGLPFALAPGWFAGLLRAVLDRLF